MQKNLPFWFATMGMVLDIVNTYGGWDDWRGARGWLARELAPHPTKLMRDDGWKCTESTVFCITFPVM